MNLPIVRIREGALPRPWGQRAVPWRQCEVIADDRVLVVDMEQRSSAGTSAGSRGRDTSTGGA